MTRVKSRYSTFYRHTLMVIAAPLLWEYSSYGYEALSHALMRSCARLPKSSLFWQHMLSLLRSCLCKVTSCVSKALFLAARALSLCKNYPEEHFFAFLRLSLLSSLLFHLRTLKIFSYQWLPVWTSWLPKGCLL